MKTFVNNKRDTFYDIDLLKFDGDNLVMRKDGKEMKFPLKIKGDNAVSFYTGKDYINCYYKRTKAGVEVFINGEYYHVECLKQSVQGIAGGEDISNGEYSAPMPGKISKVQATVGNVIKKGDLLIYLEAMKMEHPIKAKVDAIVEEVFVNVGQQVTQGQLLLKLKAL